MAIALDQIGCRGYAAELLASGVGREDVRRYGFAFEGKRVFIG